MPVLLDAGSPDFAAAFARLLERQTNTASAVAGTVADIIADILKRGDQALLEYTARFDRVKLDVKGLRISADEIANARAAVPAETLKALELAASRIESFHRRQIPAGDQWQDDAGVGLGFRWTPLDAVGIYVPGGKANYPSSVLMNAIPARVAGVARVVMNVPTPDRVLNPLVLAAADLAGVTEIYRVGGAQAVAALAYGTATIEPVDKITGPGNAYVAEAKRQVFGQVGIDMIAGPSEILVIADNRNDPAWIAADLLSQAEHDEAAQSILITDDRDFGTAVAQAVERHLETLPRAEIARASWDNNGAIITVPELDAAAPLADRIAAEHLELAVADPDRLAARISHAGAIFLGRHTPEAIGDYVAGPNHVLPTARSARFSSGLSVLDFMKRTSILRLNAAALEKLSPAAMTLASAEGLEAHRRSVEIRRSRS